jgi:hypothetical protein
MASRKPKGAPALTCIVGNTTSDLSQRERELVIAFRTMNVEGSEFLLDLAQRISAGPVKRNRASRLIAGRNIAVSVTS